MLLILAATAIASITNDGIIDKAQNATSKYEIAQEKESLQMAALERFLINSTGNLTLENHLAEKYGEENVQLNADGSVTVTMPSGNKYVVTEDGNVTLLDGSVQEPEAEPISVSLDKTEITKEITHGESVTETITATLNNATGTLTWLSSDPDVAEIATSEGNTRTIEIKKAGTAIITVKYAENTSIGAACTITVTEQKITLTVTPTTINEEIEKGSTVEKTLIANLVNASGDLTWNSSNTTVASVTGNGTTATVILKAEGTAIITVSYEGTVSATCIINVTEFAMPQVVVGVKATENSTINGEEYSATNPIIPAGFAPINTETSNWNATDLAGEVKKGLVISDGTSEFVWIPVASINNMIMCQTHGASVTLNEETLQCPTCGESTKLAGKLYATSTGENFNSSQAGQTYGLNTGLRETDVVTSASGTDSTTGSLYDAANLSTVLEGTYAETQTVASFKLQLEAEFKNMAQSVAKYKGFYVGRYETSLNGTTAQSKSEETPMNNIKWYNMYNNSKTYSRANTELGVVSEMIWGCQYDQVMQLILSNPIDASHVTAKTNVGHKSSEFTSKPYETGGTNYTEVYTGSTTYNDIASNIYDLEGNLNEWTQEASGTYIRVARGGSYRNSYSPSYRNGDYPTNNFSNYGSRLSLYVEL